MNSNSLPLPIDELLPQIRTTLSANSNLIITAAPGAGKSTRVPPALLNEPWHRCSTKSLQLVMLQPRRVAARAVAARIAGEHNWRIGEEVGYQIRFENRTTPRTRLRVVTEGILARQLAGDPFLENVGGVILDEFHERSLHSDLALALLREIQRTVRPELRIIIMSATLDTAPISEYLNNASVISAPGRLFPVEIEFQPRRDSRPLADLCATSLQRILQHQKNSGHILCFLPGLAEIRHTNTVIKNLAENSNLAIHILHSSVPPAAQDAALHPSKQRKLILATNIAETSLTIEGVTAVIDSGLARIPIEDARLGIDRLELRHISQASAAQRAGRAGRTASGLCLRLWTQAEDAATPPYETPEIRRLDLSSALLAIKHFGYADPAQFPWFEAPRPDALARAAQLLTWLGAVDDHGALTELGRALTRLPLPPRLGCLLLAGARASAAEEGATLAALLYEGESILNASTRRTAAKLEGDSDLIDRLEDFTANTPNLSRTREQLLRSVNEIKPGSKSKNASNNSSSVLRKLLLHAYPDRVTIRRANDPSRGLMVGGRGISLEPASIVRRAPLFLSLDPREPPPTAPQREARVSLASAIEPAWLEEIFPHLLRREKVAAWNADRQKVLSINRLYYLDLAIEEKDTPADSDDPETARILSEALRPVAQQIMTAEASTAQWLARARFLCHAMPELRFPPFDDDSLSSIFESACFGKTSRAELNSLDWHSYLETSLNGTQRAALAREVPESLAVPSGSKIKLDYLSGDAPILAVRLQELFGWADSPRLAAGRVPVLLHLLGPNYRPVQITRDLKNFWNTTYKEVRKDLRARYPKHPWPEDPWNAPAISVGRRRK